MVQKEVADRMQVGPGTKDYGALSLAVQYYAYPQIILNVPASCFMPRPNVDSAVIKLTRHAKTPVDVDNEKLMFKIIRASFNQRRKRLQMVLITVVRFNFQRRLFRSLLKRWNCLPSIRGEALTLQQFAALSNIINAKLK